MNGEIRYMRASARAETQKREAIAWNNNVPMRKLGFVEPANADIQKNSKPFQDLKDDNARIARVYVDSLTYLNEHIDAHFRAYECAKPEPVNEPIIAYLSQRERMMNNEECLLFMHAWLKHHKGANVCEWFYGMCKASGVKFDNSMENIITREKVAREKKARLTSKEDNAQYVKTRGFTLNDMGRRVSKKKLDASTKRTITGIRNAMEKKP